MIKTLAIGTGLAVGYIGVYTVTYVGTLASLAAAGYVVGRIDEEIQYKKLLKQEQVVKNFNK